MCSWVFTLFPSVVFHGFVIYSLSNQKGVPCSNITRAGDPFHPSCRLPVIGPDPCPCSTNDGLVLDFLQALATEVQIKNAPRDVKRRLLKVIFEDIRYTVKRGQTTGEIPSSYKVTDRSRGTRMKPWGNKRELIHPFIKGFA